MYYTLIGIIALLVLIITNHDIFFHWPKDASDVLKTYRRFLFGIAAYYITDMLWGFLDSVHLMSLLFIDTEIYFIAMALGIFLWTQYVVVYLEENREFSFFLQCAGVLFFIIEAIIVFINLFIPILFCFDGQGAYHTGIGRNIMLIVQIVLLSLTSVYALRAASSADEAKRNRYRTIGFFGLIMVFFLSIQYFYPLLPLYSIGYMLGSCLLRTFVIENEKEEYRRDLEASLQREKDQLEELISARELAYTDALTGVRSKLAYMEKEEQIDKEIADGIKANFAVVAFDLNGLKYTNDTLGHEEGDKLVVDAAKLISQCFPNSVVYRIGGDEFATILEGEDFKNRKQLLAEFNRRTEENIINNNVVVSAGMTDYLAYADNSYDRVFNRADQEMYKRKYELKQVGVYKR